MRLILRRIGISGLGLIGSLLISRLGLYRLIS
jgi:hypothetical protein